jgi:transposase InsO family protein
MNYKRKYHPLVVLLYASNMLNKEQTKQIPKTTRAYWNEFDHNNYYGADWAEKYIDQFDQIKEVYASSFLFKSMVFMVQARQGFMKIIQEVKESKTLIRKHAQAMVKSVDFMRKKTKLKVDSICKYLDISRDWYFKQKKKVVCQMNPLNVCFRRHPNQLTLKESSTIESIVMHPKNVGRTLTTLYYESLRKDMIACAKSTFFNYANAHGYKRPIYPKQKRKKGLKASRIFEWLHIDVTYVPTLNDGMQKVAFVKDNFSKAILHYGSTDKKAGSIFIRDLFIETFKKYNLMSFTEDIHILSDKGSENKGFFTEWIDSLDAPPLVKKITAKSDGFPFSNSMSESTHSIYKTEFLRKKVSNTQLEHLDNLDRFVVYYNDERYPTDHFSYTSKEVLNGEIPNRDQFKEQISNARKERVRINQNFRECYI